MLMLVSGATRYPRSGNVGHLIVPAQGNTTLDLQPGRWAMDNGAFSGFNEGRFMRMLERFHNRPGCLFAVAPDVVGDHAATLDRWPFWSTVIKALGLPPAFVIQEGCETYDQVPDDAACIFVGGEANRYKEGPQARSICSYAKARGQWVHWGRVNGRRRYEIALKSGADSFDGSSFSLAPDTNIPLAEEWREGISQQPELSEL